MKALAKGSVRGMVVLLPILAVALALGSGDQVVRAATITVNSTGDSGPGSLRQAISDASPGDTIEFAVTGTIVLTSGPLTINKSLTINGPGSGDLAISGNNAIGGFRVFTVSPGSPVSISDVTIQNGPERTQNGNFFVGSGVLNGGTLTLTNSTVSNNLGSGIANTGTLTLTNSTVSGNTAGNGGGGIYNTIGGMVTLTNSTINGNTDEGEAVSSTMAP